jgi:hypothetical protein
MLATVILLWRYAVSKLTDQDPWLEIEPTHLPPAPGTRLLVPLRRWWRNMRQPGEKLS